MISAIPAHALLRQIAYASAKMGDFARYAKEIGCEVGEAGTPMCDSIVATPEQVEKLEAWWRANT